jgi:hypothetical protein
MGMHCCFNCNQPVRWSPGEDGYVHIHNGAPICPAPDPKPDLAALDQAVIDTADACYGNSNNQTALWKAIRARRRAIAGLAAARRTWTVTTEERPVEHIDRYIDPHGGTGSNIGFAREGSIAIGKTRHVIVSVEPT